MAKAVVHLVKITIRRDFTKTGTLCNRMTLTEDGLNSTDDKEKVTCKICRKHPAF